MKFSIDKRNSNWEALEAKRFKAERLMEAYNWKSQLNRDFPVILSLMGGTGTGKSTLFNSFVGEKISRAGDKRPSTVKPMIMVPERFVQDVQNCPFFIFSDIVPSPTDFGNIVLVDTPDFDSIERHHHTIAENFFIISDVVIFVTSEEKYADLTADMMGSLALQWGKKCFFLMNKADSDEAFNDFRLALTDKGHEQEPIRIGRFHPRPDFIPGLGQISQFLFLFGSQPELSGEIRRNEINSLRLNAKRAVDDLSQSLGELSEKIASVNRVVDDCRNQALYEMEHQLDVIVTNDVESQIQGRLQLLFRKYDLLYGPRTALRKTLKTVFSAIADPVIRMLSGQAAAIESTDPKDMADAKSAARLKPLENAVSRLNRSIAAYLSDTPGMQDFRLVASNAVKRMSPEEIREKYEQSFPGIESLLEQEFDRFRNGLSRSDEVKLYGSYTFWALMLLTVEIVVGGGFTLLDAILDTVIVPFIPKWLLDLKVVDVLRQIGEQIDQKHRNALSGILGEQADAYIREFSLLGPEGRTLRKLNFHRRTLESSS